MLTHVHLSPPAGPHPSSHLRSTFLTNRERAIDYLNTLERLYVVDAFVNWDKQVGQEGGEVVGHQRLVLATGNEPGLVQVTASAKKQAAPNKATYSSTCTLLPS